MPAHVAGTVHFDLLAKLLADDRRSDFAGERRERLADPHTSCRVERSPTRCWASRFPISPSATDPAGRGSLPSISPAGRWCWFLIPGYSCNACVHNLCELNADLDRFRSFKAEVVAISGDPSEVTRQRFNQFGSFGFTVLSDPDHTVAARQYGTCQAELAPSDPETLFTGQA